MFRQLKQDHRSGVLNFVAIVSSILLVLITQDVCNAQVTRQTPSDRRVAARPAELTRVRAEVIQKIKETRAGAEKLLALHEGERARMAEIYEQRREQYYMGLISRSEVLQAENDLAQAILRIDEDKRWLNETDMALTEYGMRDELLQLPTLAVGAFSASSSLLRFNGGALWSLGDATKIENFFTQTFGRALPISAYGQSPTHDRLRFDHRNAMDVALHPDSREGQTLLSYLRQAGIPFIAFRGAAPGAATGAHIHIGKPSPRN